MIAGKKEGKINMKKTLIIFVICLIGCFLITGCSKGEENDITSKLQEKTESVKDNADEKPKKEKKKKKTKTEDTSKESDIHAVSSGEAVYYDGKVMFRNYNMTSYDMWALNGEFGRNSHAYQSNSIYTFDPEAPDKGIELLCEDFGTGKMYLINGTDLYSQLIAEGREDENNRRVYKKHLPDGKDEEICNGEIKGFSPDGQHFVVYNYTNDEYMQHYYIYSAGDTDVDTAHYESGSITTFLGMDNDAAYFMGRNDGDTYDVVKLTNDGREYYLASCDFSSADPQYGSDYPQYDGNITFKDGNMTFRCDFYEGTGHFYYGSANVTIPVAAEGGSFDVPLYEPEIDEFISDRDDDGIPIDPESLLPKEIKDIAYDYPAYESGNGTAHVLQYYEKLDGGIFYTMAQCHREPLEDVGWRESYGLQNIKYYFIPDGKTEPVLLHTMFEPLGARGSLAHYEYYERQPTIFAYAQFLTDNGEHLIGVLYEPINVEGPEMPIITSDTYYVARVADDFYYEHPHGDDIYEDFDVDDLNAFTEMIYSWIPAKDVPVKTVGLDADGNISYDPEMSIGEKEGVYMCHLAFDADGRVYYIRPVIME